MKTLKRLFWSFVFFGAVGMTFYVPLAYHFVIYRGNYFLVKKDSLTWDNTLLNLDKKPVKWVVVVDSSSLRKYFWEHYQQALKKRLAKEKRSLWQSLKKDFSKKLKTFKKKIKEQLSEEALKKLKEKAQKKLNP